MEEWKVGRWKGETMERDNGIRIVEKGRWGEGKDWKGKLGREPGGESEGGKGGREAKKWEMKKARIRIVEEAGSTSRCLMEKR